MALLALCALIAAACGGDEAESGPPDLSAIPSATLPAELPTPVIVGGGAVLPGGGTTYTIQSGDTFSDIAAEFGITVDELLAANPGIDPRGLVAGDVIRLPSGVEPGAPRPEPTESEPEPTEEPAPTDTPVPAPTNTPSALGQTYTVQAGDIPVDIAARFGITVEALLAANPDANPSNLQVGQVLIIPPAATPAP